MRWRSPPQASPDCNNLALTRERNAPFGLVQSPAPGNPTKSATEPQIFGG
ncbi:hypothetical protein [Nostoc sp.]